VGFAVALRDGEHLLGSLSVVMPGASLTAALAQNHADTAAKRGRPHRRPAAGPARQSPRHPKNGNTMNAPLPLSAVPALPGQPQHVPVVIVGAGPTGLMLANLLGMQGVEALVIERNTSTVGEPRAVTIDDESLRTVQATGLITDVLPHVVQGYGVHYHSWRGKVFARIEPQAMEHGFPKRNAFRQQVLVGQLRDGLQRFAGSDIWFGHELVKFRDDGDKGNGVQLELRHGGETRHLRCDWLVACDGGRSSVREQLGIQLTGSTYDEKWLIVDLLERNSAFRHTRTYCDPARPAIRLPGPDGTLRYEFMLHEGEDPDEMLDEARVRGWIHAREPADARLPITRKVVYAFHARVASRWKAGRVLLAGDAAHLTPPFAGQGMNSGVRDAANLAWKLAAVVQGRLPASPAGQLRDRTQAARLVADPDGRAHRHLHATQIGAGRHADAGRAQALQRLSAGARLRAAAQIQAQAAFL
jgi:3-(3-hydroxy-phenyl)propionate hydroxylase